MGSDKIINVDDMNYAIYKIGDWKNNYEINQIGLSREIPVTKHTITHVKLSMEEIRSTLFETAIGTVNGFVAIALQMSQKVYEMDLDDAIALEEKEYNNILEELDALELLGDDESIPLETEDYLIYHLIKDCHVTNSIPANKFTEKYHNDEMKRIEDALL